MKLTQDDPKLTAYVLGELSEAEAKEIETEIKNSPELTQAVAEIRQTAELLAKEFSAEPAVVLSENQKEAVVTKVQPDNVIPFPRRKLWGAVGISAIAASIALLLVLQFGGSPKSRKMTLAKNDLPLLVPENRGLVDPAGTPAARSAQPKSGVVPGTASDSSLRPEKEKVVMLGAIPEKIADITQAESKSVDLNFAAPALQKKEGLGRNPQLTTISGSSSTTTLLTDSFTPTSPAGEAIISGYKVADKSKVSQTRSLAANGTAATPGSSGRLITGLPQSESAQRYDYNDGRKGAFYFRQQVPGQQYGLESEHSQTARYPKYVENAFESAVQNPLSTFSIDVDTASYANVRRFLSGNQLPPGDAVRIEEMVNYFSYNYPQPKGDEPFAANIEIAGCPWNNAHRLVRVGLKGKEMAQDKRPPSNFVFLIDVSGSMSPAERLPLIKQALRMLVKRMTENDRIGIVVYASSSGVVLESTSCVNKEKILEALDRLEAGGSTNGGQGIQRAYDLASENFIKGGVNRVILCTDGDFNVGITSHDDLLNLIKAKAKSGVFLSALGVGTDNYKDALMQKLADSGNGNYNYIDSMEEAQKVLVQQMNGTLVTIAKDVKIQIEFNPAQVSSYRLIGYEKRILAAEDFNNDKKDAGEIGAGHTVTALYEIVPAGGEEVASSPLVDDLKYQAKPTAKAKRILVDNGSKELMTLKLRYKKPDENVSKLSEFTVIDGGKKFSQASTDFQFASAVAGFGMILKNSENKGNATMSSILSLAENSKGEDKEGYRAEFINLMKKATTLQRGE